MMGDFGRRKPVTEDWISGLPDDILCCILSFVTLKEAGRTSALSKRWENVWKFVTDLDFDAIPTLFEAETDEEYRISLKREMPKFVDWVHKVLASRNQTVALRKFRIRIHSDDSIGAELNKWLQFAFDKGVERLEVNLSWHGPCGFKTHYVFPSAIFAAAQRQRSWDCLKVMIMKRVAVSGDDLDFLLHNCKLLETLRVHWSSTLNALQVRGPSLAIRHLDVRHCSLNSLIVCNAYNLVSLKSGLPRQELVLNNVPRLVDTHICILSYYAKDLVRRLSCAFSTLEILVILMEAEMNKEYVGKFPQLPTLKQLRVRLFFRKDMKSLRGLTDLFRASPNLEQCIIDVLYLHRDEEVSVHGDSVEKANVENYPLRHLRVVEISGCCGRAVELQLVKYFLGNASSLEKIIVAPRRLHMVLTEEPLFQDKTRFDRMTKCWGRFSEQQLLRIMPPHVTLQILQHSEHHFLSGWIKS
ncbi:OLC1v1012392C1 [Oldenlandia corymbosa var. corymbosa]|uniref:OLC1v1012392C1 n=1 Tax=Oldenlandia corymbosa var. corymbosa TaxID=529605 RepID=A0AAV1DWH6_OLDCO|nr:OLC1v1012392C1 [Oldenlandia corymbosa var. corymbosa]